jgi:hypothetical protein
MEVCRGQDFLFAGSQPTLARLRLALGAVPVATGIIRHGRLVTTLQTSVEVAAQGCRAAVLDGAEHFQLLKAEARPVSVEKAVTLCADDIGHLHGGPAHFRLLRV